MKVILRISKAESIHPSPIHRKDKRERVKTCFNSLVQAGFSDITILADHIEDWKDDYKNVTFVDAYTSGNFETFYSQLEIAQHQDKVLICEDDYLWRPNIAQELEEAVDELGFVFPYDHPGHYMEKRFAENFTIKLVGNNTYRSCPSNTLTFATRGNVIKLYWDIFTGNGIRDHEMFTELSKRISLWCPTYSFSTHLVEGLLAPNVDWFANL